MSLVFHIPHSSTTIPSEYRPHFYPDDQQLQQEILYMTDWFTEELFNPAVSELGNAIVFPISRLLVDPERFHNDEQETMSKVGMGVLYECTAHGSKLKERKHIDGEYRQELLKKFYYPHHSRLQSAVEAELQSSGKCLIVDCHSFPSHPLPYESNQQFPRADICIGADPFHTPDTLVKTLVRRFKHAGISVSVNDPFEGTITPLKYYRKNEKVCSVMIEVNRGIYMDEQSAIKLEYFPRLQRILIDTLQKSAIEMSFLK
jgi:N-formylglutamate deformylase